MLVDQIASLAQYGHRIIVAHVSGGSRGGSRGAKEPPFCQDPIDKPYSTARKYATSLVFILPRVRAS